MEPPRSADVLASTLRTGDVVVFNRFCRGRSCAPRSAPASKYGLSGDGPRLLEPRGAGVVRDRRRRGARLLEGGAGAVAMRTYEERMGEFADATEAVLLRAGAEASDDAAAAGLDRLLRDELRLRPSPDGFDAPGASRCDNLAEVYRQLRAQQAPRAARRADGDADAGCNFGAPLVAREGLQRLGLVDGGVAVESVTPARLFSLRRAPRVVLEWDFWIVHTSGPRAVHTCTSCRDRTRRPHRARAPPMVLLTTISTIRGVFGGAGRTLMGDAAVVWPSCGSCLEAASASCTHAATSTSPSFARRRRRRTHTGVHVESLDCACSVPPADAVERAPTPPTL